MKLVGRVAAAGKLAAALIPKAESTPAAAAPDTRVSFSDQSPAGPSGSKDAAGAAGEEESGAEMTGGEAPEGSVWDPPPRVELPFGKVDDTRTFTQVRMLDSLLCLSPRTLHKKMIFKVLYIQLLHCARFLIIE